MWSDCISCDLYDLDKRLHWFMPVIFTNIWCLFLACALTECFIVVPGD